MSEQPTRGKRPWDAVPLRDYITIRITQERVSHVGPATEAQVRLLVIALDEVYTSRRDRLASLGWLLGRTVESTKDLRKSEASMLISWLNSDPDVAAIEADRVLKACLTEQGQLALDLPAPEEGHDERLARLRETFAGPTDRLKDALDKEA